jgi:RimJ/RimL family protein N-acetyltransferase
MDTPAPGEVRLRAVTDADLPILYEHQRDAGAAAMAGVPSRDRAAFDAHWARIRADPTGRERVIEVDGQVAGSLVCFIRDGVREVGYWIDRAYWGRGVASRALVLFLQEETTRPLHATALRSNLASLRVLEKAGFRVTGGDAEETHLTLP